MKATIPFGKWKDSDIRDVPKDYLVFLSRQDWFFRDFNILFNAVVVELDDRDKYEVEG